MRLTLLAATLVAARPRPTALRAALRRRGGDIIEESARDLQTFTGKGRRARRPQRTGARGGVH